MLDNNEEMFPIVDEEGNITGAATRKECHSGSKLLHPVVHLHVSIQKENYTYRNDRHGRIFNRENGIPQ